MIKPLQSTLIGGVLLAWPGLALAADAKPGAKAEPGMPQLDGYWYASQIFWLAITFIFFLVLCWKVILPLSLANIFVTGLVILWLKELGV